MRFETRAAFAASIAPLPILGPTIPRAMPVGAGLATASLRRA